MLSLDLTDQLARFPHAYGYQPVQGWSVKHEETTMSQSIQYTRQNALGEGPWDGVDNLYADAFEIPSGDYAFHPGIGTDPSDIFFPNEPPHPWTAWISAKTPYGLSAEQSAKLFGKYRCLRTPDFNGAGVQIDVNGNPVGGGDPRNYYFFKPNPANCAVDQLIRWGQRQNAIVNYPAYVDWRDFNDEHIPWDDARLTPRNLSLTGTAGGTFAPGNTFYVRVSGMKGVNESSASQQTIETTASTITLLGGQSAFQVSWLLKGDEEQPPVPPGDITGFRVYIGTVPGVWTGYFTVANPTFRTLLVTTLAGITAGAPRETCTAGLLRNIVRFECGLFFVPPYSLGASLNRICQISCADWQWSGLGTETYRNDKIRFLSPATREQIFTLDLAQTGQGSFKTWPIDRRQRYNQIIGNFRDKDDPVYAPGTPVILNREQMQTDDKQTRSLTIDFGTCYRSQVQRGCSYWARVLCDMDQMASMKGSPKTYFLLPGDVSRVTNTTPDWENVTFILRRKSERVESNSLGDDLTLQLYAPDMYSDTSHSPLPRNLPKAKVDPFVAPPAVTALVLTETNSVSVAGVPQIMIHGAIQAASFSQPQILRVWVKPPGAADFESTGILLRPSPDTLQASFDIPAQSTEALPWTYAVRVTTESQLGFSLAPGDHTTETIIIVGPPAPTNPSNFLCFFDYGNQDALLEWVGQSQARDSWEVYELEFLNGSNLPLAPPRVIAVKPSLNRHLQEYIVWAPAGGVTLLGEGSLDLTGGSATSAAGAEIVGGLLAEFEAPPVANESWQSLPVYVSLFPSFSYGYSGDYAFLWQFLQPVDHPNEWWAYPEGFAGGTHNAYRQKVKGGERYGVYLRPDGIGEYHINYTSSSTPIFISPRPVLPAYKYFAYASSVGGPGGIRRARWLRQGPEWKLIAGAQDLMYGGHPDPLKARVRQLSPYPFGPASNWVYGSFAR